MPVDTPGWRTYIRVHDKLERLPEFLLVRIQLHARTRYVGMPGFNGTDRRI